MVRRPSGGGPAPRRSLLAICSAAWLAACAPTASTASTASPPPTAPIAATPTQAPTSAAPPASATPETTPTQPRCVIPKLETAPLVAAAPPRSLCADNRVDERAVARAINKDFFHTVPGSTVDVSFACDGMGEQIDELIVERGSGHGGSLSLYHLRRMSERPDTFEVRGLTYRRTGGSYQEYTYEIAAQFEVERIRDELPAKDLERILGQVRAGLTARVRELEPPARRVGQGRRSSSSTADFHAVVQLTDASGRSLSGRYSGYPGSSGQRDYLGLSAAMDPLARLLEPFEPVAGEFDEIDRAQFEARFTAEVRHGGAWWVRERYTSMASVLGTPRLLPPLLKLLRDNAPMAGAHLERTGALKMRAGSEDRTRVQAMNAITALTGFDARGGPRTVDEASAEYLEACRSAPP